MPIHDCNDSACRHGACKICLLPCRECEEEDDLDRMISEELAQKERFRVVGDRPVGPFNPIRFKK